MLPSLRPGVAIKGISELLRQPHGPTTRATHVLVLIGLGDSHLKKVTLY
jgi:hypothetical protein